ncbi:MULTISPECIES: LysR family transcriptional regulator [Streptomyces]|uniref:LysR family transcriptional regulator n=1 Tax=Streptomyces virginiae TaxID=1961 RepID=A0ABQ3NM49_STRVG|nr:MULTISPECIES: LysR substrate-binding domain-containing protein [Streptomyces]KOV01648.1 LysR family transcriptional regulator [Streptomyces sp. XY511]MBP2342265.1 DNA-binding transcriptional LysR family regulator [Streptomyces virginiae]GGQ23111.1 LysR family transcriptional regulator [Streptomyces virginiae]GHI13850.1 LysR family transcriptional regulator [Streptomyces virginiae]
MIDVQRLRVLRAVAEHGSFNKAAGALLLTPSAVSQHIAALERALGHPVAVRSTRGVTLTEPGRLLVEAAETITAELDQVRRAIDRLTQERPRLTVATFTSGGRHLLPAALTRFVQAHPEVELTVLESEPEDAVPMVRGGAADLALAYHFDGPPPVGPGVRRDLGWQPLMEDPLWVVLPRGHRLAGRSSVDLGELSADRWVLGCLKTEAFLRRYAELAGFDLRVGASTTDYFFARTLVAAGVGVSLVPRVALAGAPETESVAVPVEPPRPARHIGLVLPRRRRANPWAEALADALTAAATAATTRIGARP